MEPHRGGQRCLRPGPRQVHGYAHEYAQDFHDAVHAYEDLACKYGLWSAVRLMGHATDDGFTDFRAWLISQGKEAYFAALKEPDTLVDLDPGDGYWFESFAYAGYYALKELVGSKTVALTELADASMLPPRYFLVIQTAIGGIYGDNKKRENLG